MKEEEKERRKGRGGEDLLYPQTPPRPPTKRDEVPFHFPPPLSHPPSVTFPFPSLLMLMLKPPLRPKLLRLRKHVLIEMVDEVAVRHDRAGRDEEVAVAVTLW